jgi:hypothetical protein
MDEIERIESDRWGLFVIEAAIAFALIYWLSLELFGSIVASIGLGWSMSGYKVARKMTQPLAWAYLEAEARISGYLPSRRGVWLGNVLPGIVIAAMGAWLIFNA